ncbi:MAG: Fe-S-containing hydro-lyase [Treponema sp.]|jgi:fumarate hydratase subunit beta|nr:Fe-S-containing hydro-lyase [Treponema sp.]
MKEIGTPFTAESISSLNCGDFVYLSGTIYTARDAAQKKLVELIESGKPLPFDFNGQAVFYAGPAPARPGKPIGSVGPTTAGRMDLYAPLLISKGLKVMIGKGLRSKEVIDAIVKYSGVYFAATGGIAALMAKCVKSANLIAFEELGTEAVRELEVERLPLVVAIDRMGRNLYERGRAEYNAVSPLNPQDNPKAACSTG